MRWTKPIPRRSKQVLEFKLRLQGRDFTLTMGKLDPVALSGTITGPVAGGLAERIMAARPGGTVSRQEMAELPGGVRAAVDELLVLILRASPADTDQISIHRRGG